MKIFIIFYQPLNILKLFSKIKYQKYTYKQIKNLPIEINLKFIIEFTEAYNKSKK